MIELEVARAMFLASCSLAAGAFTMVLARRELRKVAARARQGIDSR